MSTEYISLLESARAELAGAERRLALARQALADFKAEHDGKVVSRDLALSLAHEKDAVETEVDAAERQMQHCTAVLAEMQQLAAAVSI
jgi:lactam utilization protein B